MCDSSVPPRAGRGGCSAITHRVLRAASCRFGLRWSHWISFVPNALALVDFRRPNEDIQSSAGLRKEPVAREMKNATKNGKSRLNGTPFTRGELLAAHQRALRRAEKMTAREGFQSLVTAGIIPRRQTESQVPRLSLRSPCLLGSPRSALPPKTQPRQLRVDSKIPGVGSEELGNALTIPHCDLNVRLERNLRSRERRATLEKHAPHSLVLIRSESASWLTV